MIFKPVTPKQIAHVRAVTALILSSFVAVPALAQQQPSSGEQALGAKLMQEIQGGLSCSTNLISAQADLAKAQARIKELEPKPETKSEEPK